MCVYVFFVILSKMIQLYFLGLFEFDFNYQTVSVYFGNWNRTLIQVERWYGAVMQGKTLVL